jgi:hypothetical protein
VPEELREDEDELLPELPWLLDGEEDRIEEFRLLEESVEREG